MQRVAVVVAMPLALVLLAPAGAGGAPSPDRVAYRPPVDAPILDPWRPPGGPYGAGNRGVDYATSPGEPVVAAADGVVSFSGQVGGHLHVVVLHADGVRTTYAFLRSIEVQRGQGVRQGERVGRARDTLHFGARIADAYVDPTLLFGDGLPHVHLVPEEDRRPGSEEQERAGLLEQLRTVLIRADTAVSDWVGDVVQEGFEEVRGLAHYAQQAAFGYTPLGVAVSQARAAYDWWEQRDGCTPAGVEPPPLQERRLAILVGGLGSTSERGGSAIDDLDTAALGYAPADVSRFSYSGGTTSDAPYSPGDTTTDLRVSARRLRLLLQRTAAENPGVPIDVLAHSQGGIVAREALTNEFDGLDHRLPAVKTLVTFASPHQGSDLATAVSMIGRRRSGGLLAKGVERYLPWDPTGPSVRQISESSSFMRDLARRPLPQGLQATSIGARDDYVVTAGRTRLDGAHHVVVTPPGVVDDHGRLPGSVQGQREAALAVNGMAPTCQGFVDSMVDAAVSNHIAMAEDAAGAMAWYGAFKADKATTPWAIWRKTRGDP